MGGEVEGKRRKEEGELKGRKGREEKRVGEGRKAGWVKMEGREARGIKYRRKGRQE